MKLNIKNYYLPAFLEKEGLGTAYEYYAKKRVLSKHSQHKDIQDILIVGMPQKYGYSMDFVIWGDNLGAEILIIEDRQEKIDKAKNIIEKLKNQKILSPNLRIQFEKVENFFDFKTQTTFDLILNCETLQRIKYPDRFIQFYNEKAKTFITFCPNGDNESHNTLSGLNSIPLSDLKKNIFPLLNLQEYGYIDFPPFPPGIKRSDEQREQANSSIFVRFFMFCLTIWCWLEKCWPNFIKKNWAHIIYFVSENEK